MLFRMDSFLNEIKVKIFTFGVKFLEIMFNMLHFHLIYSVWCCNKIFFSLKWHHSWSLECSCRTNHTSLAKAFICNLLNSFHRLLVRHQGYFLLYNMPHKRKPHFLNSWLDSWCRHELTEAFAIRVSAPAFYFLLLQKSKIRSAAWDVVLGHNLVQISSRCTWTWTDYLHLHSLSRVQRLSYAAPKTPKMKMGTWICVRFPLIPGIWIS